MFHNENIFLIGLGTADWVVFLVVLVICFKLQFDACGLETGSIFYSSLFERVPIFDLDRLYSFLMVFPFKFNNVCFRTASIYGELQVAN